jgi:hypothetical protein
MLVMMIFCGYQEGLKSTGWPHTIQLGEPNCRGPEALSHQKTSHTRPITLPGGAQHPDQKQQGS